MIWIWKNVKPERWCRKMSSQKEMILSNPFSLADKYQYLSKQCRSKWDGLLWAISSGSKSCLPFSFFILDFNQIQEWKSPLQKFRDERVKCVCWAWFWGVVGTGQSKIISLKRIIRTWYVNIILMKRGFFPHRHTHAHMHVHTHRHTHPHTPTSTHPRIKDNRHNMLGRNTS